MIKRIVVTGVSGQDGSYMVDYLLANTSHDIWGMVRRTSKPDLGNLKDALSNPRFKLITGDLSDSASIDNVVKEVMPDYFINLAAQSFVGSSWQIPEQTFDVDAVAVIRILEAIRKHVPQCRTYLAGSSEQFGDVQYSPQDISHPQRARSPYGAAKVASQQIVKVWRESYRLYAIQGILFNHESERRGEEFVTRKITLGVARIAKAIKEGKPFEPISLGNLDAKRDWSHAEDFVDGIWRMLNQEVHRQGYSDASLGSNDPKVSRSILKEYVLSSGETHTVREFVEKAFAAAGIQGQWEFPRNGKRDPKEEVFSFTYGYVYDGKTAVLTEPLLAHVVIDGVPSNPRPLDSLVCINPAFYRPCEVSLLHGDSTLARTELGWSPKVSFDELVKRMVENDLAAVGL